MRTAVKHYSIYWILFLSYVLFGGIALLVIDKGAVVIFFSEHRTAFGDFFFTWITRLGEWVPYVVGFVIFLFLKEYKKAISIPLLAGLVTAVSFVTKSIFRQPRPARYFKDLDQLDEINQVSGIVLHYGSTSFPSGHTMSAFAVSLFLLLCFRRKWWLEIALFTLALLVATSRIYLVQHFFQDVYLGAILGTAVGLLSYLLLDVIERKTQKP